MRMTRREMLLIVFALYLLPWSGVNGGKKTKQDGKELNGQQNILSQYLHFSYENDAADGPSHWGGDCQHVGKQSPIDIPFDRIIYDPSIWGLTFKNYDTNSSTLNFILENDGHFARVTVKGNPAPSIVNGGLKTEYFVDQFHFHWGPDDLHGSEHRFDRREFPMEVHIVHRTTNPNAPVNEKVAAIAVIFELSDEPNPRLDNLISNLQNILTPGKHIDLPAFKVIDILPTRTDRYFRYYGSFTVPPCSEDVVWTVFYDRVLIAASQEAEFRKLIEEHGKAATNNQRPVQQIGTRVVRSSFMPFIVSIRVIASVPVIATVLATLFHSIYR